MLKMKFNLFRIKWKWKDKGKLHQQEVLGDMDDQFLTFLQTFKRWINGNRYYVSPKKCKTHRTPKYFTTMFSPHLVGST